MKKVLFTLSALSAFAAQLSAQSVPKRYDVTYSAVGTYAPLSGTATMIPFPVDWDDEISDPITLPFTFKYQNAVVSNVEVETYGSLYLNGIEDFDLGHITGLNMDYDSKNRGKVYYETSGTIGSRIFKVEYRNVGRFDDVMNTDTLNFQIWLYESNNAIEYRAGYCNVPATAFAASLLDLMNGNEFLSAGLIENSGNSISSISDSSAFHAVKFAGTTLVDTSADFSVLQNSTTGEEYVDLLLGKYPPMGSVIRFAPGSTTGISKIDFDLATVFPNPSKDGRYTFTLKENLQNTSLYVFDLTGKLVRQESLTGTTHALDLSKLAAGQYMVQIKSDRNLGMFKLVKEL